MIRQRRELYAKNSSALVRIEVPKSSYRILRRKRDTNAFLVFRNARNEEITVLFRRTDGNLGLIEPET